MEIEQDTLRANTHTIIEDHSLIAKGKSHEDKASKGIDLGINQVMISHFGIGFNIMRPIEEPIYIYAKDSGELWKYKTIDFAEKEIEVYDFDNYDIFDGTYRKLKPYKKDKYNRVGFESTDNIEENRLKQYAIEELMQRCHIHDKISLNKMETKELLGKLPFE